MDTPIPKRRIEEIRKWLRDHQPPDWRRRCIRGATPGASGRDDYHGGEWAYYCPNCGKETTDFKRCPCGYPNFPNDWAKCKWAEWFYVRYLLGRITGKNESVKEQP